MSTAVKTDIAYVVLISLIVKLNTTYAMSIFVFLSY